MGAGIGAAAVVVVALASGAADFDDELHAVAPTRPSASVSARSDPDRRVRMVGTTDLPRSSRAQRTLPPMTDSRDLESVERVIPAPAADIFALLADPSRHQDIDGSGSVHDAKNPPQRVKLGDTFGMAMKRGVPYSTTNTVVEFEDDRRIAWKTGSTGFVGKVLGGPIWRYELEPVDGGTLVRETLGPLRDARREAVAPAGHGPQGHAQQHGEDAREHREACSACGRSGRRGRTGLSDDPGSPGATRQSARSKASSATSALMLRRSITRVTSMWRGSSIVSAPAAITGYTKPSIVP